MDQDTHRLLGSLEAKVDILLERTASEVTEREKDRERISKIEHELTATKAVAGVISAIVAFVASIGIDYFHK